MSTNSAADLLLGCAKSGVDVALHLRRLTGSRHRAVREKRLKSVCSKRLLVTMLEIVKVNRRELCLRASKNAKEPTNPGLHVLDRLKGTCWASGQQVLAHVSHLVL